MNVGHVERVCELSAGRIARMRDQVDFCETGTLHVPAIRLHWNVVLEQIARFGTPVDSPSLLRLGRFQPPVDLSRADFQQLFLDLPPQMKAFADPRHPRRQQRLQPHRPGIASCLPYRRQYSESFLVVAHPALPGRSASLLWPRPIQQTDRILPVVSSVRAKLAQNHFLALPSCRLVTLIDRSQILPLPLVSQPDLLKNCSLVGLHSKWRDVRTFGYILDGAIRILDPSPGQSVECGHQRTRG